MQSPVQSISMTVSHIRQVSQDNQVLKRVACMAIIGLSLLLNKYSPSMISVPIVSLMTWRTINPQPHRTVAKMDSFTSFRVFSLLMCGSFAAHLLFYWPAMTSLVALIAFETFLIYKVGGFILDNMRQWILCRSSFDVPVAFMFLATFSLMNSLSSGTMVYYTATCINAINIMKRNNYSRTQFLATSMFAIMMNLVLTITKSRDYVIINLVMGKLFTSIMAYLATAPSQISATKESLILNMTSENDVTVPAVHGETQDNQSNHFAVNVKADDSADTTPTSIFKAASPLRSCMVSKTAESKHSRCVQFTASEVCEFDNSRPAHIICLGSRSRVETASEDHHRPDMYYDDEDEEEDTKQDDFVGGYYSAIDSSDDDDLSPLCADDFIMSPLSEDDDSSDYDSDMSPYSDDESSPRRCGDFVMSSDCESEPTDMYFVTRTIQRTDIPSHTPEVWSWTDSDSDCCSSAEFSDDDITSTREQYKSSDFDEVSFAIWQFISEVFPSPNSSATRTYPTDMDGCFVIDCETNSAFYKNGIAPLVLTPRAVPVSKTLTAVVTGSTGNAFEMIL